MELKNQVTSLKISQRLKELKVKQESLYYYDKEGKLFYSEEPLQSLYGMYSAFNVCELGMLLPFGSKSFHRDKYDDDYRKGKNWQVTLPIGNKRHLEYADHEANARGKMAIYLIENDLRTPNPN